MAACMLTVHWVRHGEVGSHRGDVPLTPAGVAGAEEQGRRLGELVESREEVRLLHAATRRTRETAAAIGRGLAATVAARGLASVTLRDPEEEPAVRNPDLYVAGQRVELVSSPEALAAQLPPAGLTAADLLGLPFWPQFWSSPDRIGFWVVHPDPPGEDSAAVARRLLTWAASLAWQPAARPRRFICVTHSPLMRAFLKRYVLGTDPGEPNWCEPIALAFPPGEPVRVTFRERTVAVPVPGYLLAGTGAPGRGAGETGTILE